MYMMRGEKFKSAQEYWDNPPIKIGEQLASRRSLINHKKGHNDYMDFAQLYADYVVSYEKANS